MEQYSSVRVLERCLVSPPLDFNPPPSLPLTFFDLKWLTLSPVQRLFFYSYHQTPTYFMNTTLPNIKHSLSLTLQHFYPLSGTLVWPSPSTKPHIRCSQENPLMLIIAESGLNFNTLLGNHTRDVKEFHPLVPQLTFAKPGTELSVMALQVTLFPGTGISIGISFLHVVADGKTTNHFMKSWASICQSGGDASCLPLDSLPFYDRKVLNDANNLENIYLSESKTFSIPTKIAKDHISKFRATFSLSRPELQKIKRLVLDQYQKCRKDHSTQLLHVSTFVLTVSYVWVCLIKVLARNDNDGMEMEHLVFPVECRELLNPPIPTTYFGNCLVMCFSDVKRTELIGEYGMAIAAEAIGNAVQRMKGEVLKDAENYFTTLKYVVKGQYLSVAGSPKLNVYDTDFGWGRPKKADVVSIETTGAIYLNERPGGDGGVEIGLVLTKHEMDAFASIFTNTVKILA